MRQGSGKDFHEMGWPGWALVLNLLTPQDLVTFLIKKQLLNKSIYMKLLCDFYCSMKMSVVEIMSHLWLWTLHRKLISSSCFDSSA